jgi:hypothetical protein
MQDLTISVCPVCQVKIEKGIPRDRVIFAHGPAQNRDVLSERVCQYAKQDGCINKFPESLK